MGQHLQPGPPIANTPNSFEYLKNSFLQNNVNITKMPTTQQEWSTFIQELSKWIKNETGVFLPTFNGFSSDPSTPSCVYHRYGQIVQLEFVFTTGTSNQTFFTITNLPATITPKLNVIQPISGLVDNNVNLANAQVEVASDGTIAFYTDGHETGWTNPGTKGFSSSVVSEKSVIYFLRNPDKQ